MKKFLNLLGVFVVFFILSCSFYRIDHSPKAATDVSLRFCKTSLLQHDYERAFNLLDNNRPADFTVEILKDLIEGMHVDSEFPHTIEPYAYEVVPGSSNLYIYLVGETSDSKSFYKVTATGNRRDGYNVSEIFHNKDEFPKNAQMIAINKNNNG